MSASTARRASHIKVYALIAATVPVLVSSALLGLIASDYFVDEQTRRWVLQNRATTQIIVQWLSMAMGACQIYVLSSILRFWTSTRLMTRPLKLDVLKCLDAIAACRLDVDIPGAFFLVLILYLSLVQVPGALWAGALTPVSANKTVVATYNIPEYSEATRYSGWGYHCPPNYRCDGMTMINSTSQGSFSYQAWKDITGLLLNSVREASSSDNSTIPQYDKLDNTRYKFNGRSFGVGSAVGLVDDPVPSKGDTGRPLSSYKYQEVGYHSQVKCLFNTASQLVLLEDTDDGPQQTYQVTGSLPLGEVGNYPVWGWGNNFGLAAVTDGRRFQYGLTGGFYLDWLNNAQCDVTFEPTLFSVEVDKDHKVITVKPSNTSSEPMDHVPIENSTASIAFFGPQYIAMTVTTLYTATFADTFWRNSLNVMRRNGRDVQIDSDYTTGIAEGLEVLLDNILGNTGASQAMTGDINSTDATVVYQAMHIGEAKYTYSTFTFSFIIFLLVLIDILRTGFWADLPLFNPLDLKSAVLGVAASTGQLGGSPLDQWDGDAADRAVGSIEVLSSDREPKLLFYGYSQTRGVVSLHEVHNGKTSEPLLRSQQQQQDQMVPWSVKWNVIQE